MTRLCGKIRSCILHITVAMILGAAFFPGTPYAKDAAAKKHLFYVSPKGDDRLTGRSPEIRQNGKDGPFRTIDRAKRAVRDLIRKGERKGPVDVVARAGDYYLKEPLVFGPEDSGTEKYPVTYRAEDGADVTISGGKLVTGWKEKKDGIWAAPFTEKTNARSEGDGSGGLRLLRVGGSLAVRARHPNADPSDPIRGGWAFADYGGNPWENGVLDVAVKGLHPAGTRISWRIQAPKDGEYRVWMRYARKNKGDPGGKSAVSVDEEDSLWLKLPGVVRNILGRFGFYGWGGRLTTIEPLPDTGGWDSYSWARACDLTLKKGNRRLTWTNIEGGGIHLDALALCTDKKWDPDSHIGRQTRDGFTIKKPETGAQVIVIQAESCEALEGESIRIPMTAPPGSKAFMTFREGDVPKWDRIEGAELHVFPRVGWVNAVVPIKEIDYGRRRVVFSGDGAKQDVRKGNRYFVENVIEALDAPGEWYYDRERSEILYKPDGADFQNVPVVVSVLDRLIELQGDSEKGRFVRHIRFEGFRFRDTDYNVAEDYYTPQDAAVVLSGAKDCSISGCDFSLLGGYALKLKNQSARCEFRGNRVHKSGQGGVIMVGNTKNQPRRCRIVGNAMSDLGLVYKHVAGVYATTGSDNVIAHNRITDVPRYGVSLKSYDKSACSHGNIVEFNDIRRTNLETHDAGAIETLGRDKADSGNVIRFNRISDSVGCLTEPDGEFLSPHFSFGFYLDDWSSGVRIVGNIVTGAMDSSIYIHGGRNNTVRNNVLIGNGDHIVRLRSRGDGFMRDIRFVNNVVQLGRDTDLVRFEKRGETGMEGVIAEWDDNVFRFPDAGPGSQERRITPLGGFSDWQKAGFDRRSLLANPGFTDPEKGDYRLKDEAPAKAVGFERIPVERIGPEGFSAAE